MSVAVEAARPVDAVGDGRLLTVGQLQELVRRARADVLAGLPPALPRAVTSAVGAAALAGAVVVLGGAGGTGETYLAAALTAVGCLAVPAGHAWPQPAPGGPVPVVLTARSSVASLAAAQRLAAGWAAGQVPQVDVLGLAVLADAPGHTPRPLSEFIGVVGGGVPAVWRIGWQGDWRLAGPDQLVPTRGLRTALHPLIAAIVAATITTSPEGTRS